ncbi:Doublestranded RNAbinding protein Staufen -like protein 2like, partial [Caligus rogercresseyi]
MIGDSGAPHMRTFTWSLKLGEYEALGCGTSKKIARNNAAQQMLSILPEEMKKK